MAKKISELVEYTGVTKNSIGSIPTLESLNLDS